MIEQALYQHLQEQDSLRPYLAEYAGKMAIFNQDVPSDKDPDWGEGPQYGRVVFTVDLQGDPERTMGGRLTLDILCKEGEQFPEEIEPIIRPLIHGYFFCKKKFVVSAQWKNTNPFTEPTNKLNGCTLFFDLLAFPVITTSTPDLIARFNAWTAELPNLHVINFDALPTAAWKPTGKEVAVYWRVVRESPAGWIPNTYQTIWNTAIVRGHIFSETPAEAANVARDLMIRLYAAKRLLKPGEAPIMVNRKNTTDNGADPLRTGQLTVEATYGVIVAFENEGTIGKVDYEGDGIYQSLN